MSEDTKDQESRRASTADTQDEAPRFDEDGLPLDRPATLDDVRGTEGSGRSVALGCTVIVALAVVAFWLLRAGVFG
jgi:hypothetical protein